MGLGLPEFYDEQLFRVERVRQSTTQGTAKVFYGDLFIEEFGDDYVLSGQEWVSKHADSHFINGRTGGKHLLAGKLEKAAQAIRDSIG